MVLLLGTSALYHRIDWTPVARARMRRMDHAAIFMLIGGGYTPLFALVAIPNGGHGALVAIWMMVVIRTLPCVGAARHSVAPSFSSALIR